MREERGKRATETLHDLKKKPVRKKGRRKGLLLRRGHKSNSMDQKVELLRGEEP